MEQFYKDLWKWVNDVNLKASKLNSEEYWVYIMNSAGELSDRYDNHSLVKKVILAHIDFLEEGYQQNKERSG